METIKTKTAAKTRRKPAAKKSGSIKAPSKNALQSIDSSDNAIEMVRRRLSTDLAPQVYNLTIEAMKLLDNRLKTEKIDTKALITLINSFTDRLTVLSGLQSPQTGTTPAEIDLLLMTFKAKFAPGETDVSTADTTVDNIIDADVGDSDT